jgi:hypothetical protein
MAQRICDGEYRSHTYPHAASRNGRRRDDVGWLDADVVAASPSSVYRVLRDTRLSRFN